MPEAIYSNSIFVFKLHPLISLFQEKLEQVHLTVVSFENMLRKSHEIYHPYYIIIEDIRKQLDWICNAVELLKAQGDLPTEEAERKRFIKQTRNRFFLDLMDMGFTPQEIAHATNMAVTFLEKLQIKQA